MAESVSQKATAQKNGTVLKVSRRHVEVLSDTWEIANGTTSSQVTADLTVGDKVEWIKKTDGIFVESAKPRTNCLMRSYRENVWPVAANLDYLFIISAGNKLFSALSIDRMSVMAESQGIPWSLVMNKIDLEPEASRELAAPYVEAGLSVIFTSAKVADGLNDLFEIIAKPSVQILALSGVSGVGKSSILNCLIPGTRTKTGEVSNRTGHGKQTTTQAIAHLYKGDRGHPALIIDLPGMQQFGVGHLSKLEVALGFPEIRKLQGQCEFNTCSHISEPHCAVKDAVEEDRISVSRFQSYVTMIQEVEEARPY